MFPISFRCEMLLLLLCFCVTFISTSGQSSIEIKAKVVDMSTNEPIPYATVRAEIAQRTYKVVQTDKLGIFILNVSDTEIAHLKLTVSAIGYRVAPVVGADVLAEKIIHLTPDIRSIDEVDIYGLSAGAVVKKAFECIPANYPLTPNKYVGFYQESVRSHISSLDNDSLLYLIEAIIEVGVPTYLRRYPEGEVSLVETRKSLSSLTDLPLRWMAGAYAPIRFDVAKKRFDFINPRYSDRYVYSFCNDTTQRTDSVYVIRFDPLSASATAVGTIVVHRESYAIVQVEFELTERGLRSGEYTTGIMFYRKNIASRNILVNYSKSGDLWHLKSAWNHVVYNTDDSRIRFTAEYLNMDMDTNAYVKSDPDKVLRYAEVLSAKPTMYNPMFWEHYRVPEGVSDYAKNTSNTIFSGDGGVLIDNHITTKDQWTPIQKIQHVISQRMQLTIGPKLNVYGLQQNGLRVSLQDDDGNPVISRQLFVKDYQWNVGFFTNLDFTISEKFSVHYQNAGSFGTFSARHFRLGTHYKWRLSRPEHHPVYAILGFGGIYNLVNQKLDKHRYTKEHPIIINSLRFDTPVVFDFYTDQFNFQGIVGLNMGLFRRYIPYFEMNYFVPVTSTNGFRITESSKGFFPSLFPVRRKIKAEANQVSIQDATAQRLASSPFMSRLQLEIGVRYRLY